MVDRVVSWVDVGGKKDVGWREIEWLTGWSVGSKLGERRMWDGER
jgi:hypothetical protein